MEVYLNKWGNSLGLRLPKHVADKYALSKGSRLVLEESDEGILLKTPKIPTLREIIDSYPEDYVPEKIWGKTLPSEEWEWDEEEPEPYE